MNKAQTQEFEKYIKKLSIKTNGEKFVLQTLLERNWNRRILLLYIDEIKSENNLIRVRCTTNKGSYNCSISDLDKLSGDKFKTEGDKTFYIQCDLSHKID